MQPSPSYVRATRLVIPETAAVSNTTDADVRRFGERRRLGNGDGTRAAFGDTASCNLLLPPKGRANGTAGMKKRDAQEQAQPDVQRVLLIFQDPLLRAVVAGLLNDEQDIEVVHACRVNEFEPSLLETHLPDVVVADRMPAAELQGLLDEIGRQIPEARLVSVNLDRDDVTVYRSHRRENAGAEDLVAAVRNPETAHRGSPRRQE